MTNSENILVAALTAGVNTASSRFRLRQYSDRLSLQGITVREHIPFFEKSCGLPSPFKMAARIPALFSTRDADLLWLGKELVQGYQTFERLLPRPRIMDVDDAIWNNFPFGRWAAKNIAKAMDAMVVGNTYLANYFEKFCNNISIVPTAIDLDRYTLRPQPSSEPEKFIIGWTGLACNYKYLSQIEPTLHRFLDDHQRAEVQVISNRPWKPTLLPPDKVRFIPWSPENEATALHAMSVGIMPLSDDKWTRGKCSFKMLQYMAVGLPTIASPVGMNTDVLKKGNCGFGPESDNAWYDALKTLHNNWALQIEMGKIGRQIVQQFYNADLVAHQLASIFKKTVGL
ncbi:MAG: glycosyltransferase family 4 protein [Sedimentisphaerales bacterium]|nr:glycosyltransferase family 4 protein [Sedimentisphaerales bacterium]